MLCLITPPFLQFNAPYPATPVLTHFLKQQGIPVVQKDFSLDIALAVFTPEILSQAEDAARAKAQPDDALAFFLESTEDYKRTILHVIAFLQGRRPELAWKIAARAFLPEGPYFQALYTDDDDSGEALLNDAFGNLGTTDRAKYLASLYLDDVTSYIQKTLDPDFGFGKYANHLSEALPSFSPLEQRLETTTTIIDSLIEEKTQNMLDDVHPDLVGLTVPFPGTLYGALRIARTIRRLSPATRIILGGGYVNSELRNLEDKRIFNYIDAISYDEGFQPLLAIIQNDLEPATTTHPSPCPAGRNRILTRDGLFAFKTAFPTPPLLTPDFTGLELDRYFNIVEMPNPLHRIWSDGFWMKMQLAQGCYWHRCAFCDLALDYIGRYEPADAKDIVDAMQHLMETTGKNGFHFVDEALSPALLSAVAKEIIRRNLSPVWWGNIRFDTAFTPELAQQLSDAGCIAVTGGLECANDRLLKLMNKGITLDGARRVFNAFKQAGILVHTYLMYAFPTETEQEAIQALDYVRKCFRDGLVQSAFWHRFALTAHSDIARRPQDFNITLVPQTLTEPRFALNEIDYDEPNAPDWTQIGAILDKALYNYTLGLGLDIPARKWFR